MGAASFTKISSSPDMVRYYVNSTDGALGEITAATLIADCGVGGALARRLTQANAAGSWGANSAAIATPNPAIDPKISVTLTPHTAGSSTITCAASYQWYRNGGSVNVLGVLGGVRGDTTVIGDYTSAILEIRFNHSISR